MGGIYLSTASEHMIIIFRWELFVRFKPNLNNIAEQQLHVDSSAGAVRPLQDRVLRICSVCQEKLNIYLNTVINPIASGGAALVFLVSLLVFCANGVVQRE